MYGHKYAIISDETNEIDCYPYPMVFASYEAAASVLFSDCYDNPNDYHIEFIDAYFVASNLYDGGWRASDIDLLISEYGRSAEIYIEYLQDIEDEIAERAKKEAQEVSD